MANRLTVKPPRLLGGSMNSRASAAVLGLLLFSGAALAAAAAPAPAYYVSPRGSDGASGTSPATPFRTLEKAASAMRGSPVKTVYLLGGAYRLAGAFILSGQDAGETWRNYPGQRPILSGDGRTPVGLYLSDTNDITVDGLTLDGFAGAGIQTHNVHDVTIENNTVRNTRSRRWAQGGINVLGGFRGGRILHNLVENSDYDGILIAPDPDKAISGLVISGNLVVRSCLKIEDCGAIHVADPGELSSDIEIAHNVVDGFGGVSRNSKGIYLDNAASNVAVEGNIVRGDGAYGFQIHGGHADNFRNNIFDVSQTKGLALYQRWGADPMIGNSFTCNIVYSRRPLRLWTQLGTGPAPADRDNLYWIEGGGPTDTVIVDAAPHVGNPGFRNPEAGAYAFTSGNPAAYCGFAPILTADVGPQGNFGS